MTDTAALVARLREYAGEVLNARDEDTPPYSNDYECALAALEAADLLDTHALSDDEKQALSITLKFRIDQLKAIESLGKTTHVAREQIDYLVSAAIKLALP